MESRKASSAVRTVLATGLLVGALDITYAWLFWFAKAGVGPQRIFQSVAAGLLGREAAVAGGGSTAALGLAVHFVNAITIVAIYCLAARRLPMLWRRPWACGLAYGLGVYLVMNFVVVPLSRAAAGSRDPLWIALSIAVHLVFVGLPCAFAARRLFAPPGTVA